LNRHNPSFFNPKFYWNSEILVRPPIMPRSVDAKRVNTQLIRECTNCLFLSSYTICCLNVCFPGSCANKFTKQQQARMHCYLDSHYQRWQTNSVPPSAIPFKPKVTSYAGNSVSKRYFFLCYSIQFKPIKLGICKDFCD